jgi:hypothetical protein
MSNTSGGSSPTQQPCPAQEEPLIEPGHVMTRKHYEELARQAATQK